ncbi:MAG TPA: hypothetical protein VJ787_05690 [Thermoleophilia bacterium]|nr:hypothetical protein [Thermoleophilia bacterium]
MRHARPPRSRPTLLLLLAALLIVGGVFGLAPPASAAPSEPTLDLTELQALLDASPTGTLDGYLKTVVGGATTASQVPDDIPLTVLGITAEPGVGTYAPFILFEATGPVIDKAGGIAMGMSGSPLYVSDGGTDKLIGALSYGYYETIGGLGLATPIQYMAAIETDHAVVPTLAPLTLQRPVVTSGGLIDEIVIAPTLEAARKIKPNKRTAVVAPLAVVQVGGLPESNRAYKRYAALLSKNGVSVLPAGPVSLGSDPDFETPLVGGAAVGAMLMHGDVWSGGLGTVTYAHDDVVVAFGHPMFFSGTSGMELANGFVHGIWANRLAPFKMISPGMIRGTVTQDRMFGIAGTTSLIPLQTPLTAHATWAPTDKTADGTSFVPEWVADSSDWQGYAGYASSFPIYEAVDAGSLAGSMETTTTVVVNDGTTDYTVTRTNLWDDGYDVLWWPTYEPDMITSMLVANDNGLAPAHIVSVDFAATIAPVRRSATIVDVAVPGGLKVGDNTVETTLRIHGQAALKTVETTLTIPEGTPLSGTLTAAGSSGGFWSSDYYAGEVPGAAAPEPKTVAEIVAEIDAMPQNNDLLITFTPGGGEGPDGSVPGGPGEAKGGADPAGSEPIAASTRLDDVVYGEVAKQTAPIWLELQPPNVAAYRQPVGVLAVLRVTPGDTTVALYKQAVDAASPILVDPAIPVSWDPEQGVGFGFTQVLGLKKNTVLTVEWGGDDLYLGATIAEMVGIRARVALRATVRPASVRLVAHVSPEQAGATVVFQRRTASGWRRLAAVQTGADGYARATWRPASGSYRVRAAFLGSDINWPANSHPVTVSVP